MALSRDKSFYRQVFRLTGWIAAQNVIVCIVGLADNIMIGAYSQDALSGVALANQLQFLLQMLVGGIGEGMAVLTAQYWGMGRMQPIRSLMAIALRIALAVGAAFFAVAQLWPREALGLLAKDADALREGAAYLRILSWSFPFFCAGLTLVNAHRSVESVTVGMAASVVALIGNIALNSVLIFGRLGFPAMGARGAALATLSARVMECGVIVWFTYRGDRKLGVSLRELWRRNRELAKDFRRIAAPVILSGGSWGIAMTVQSGILGHLGSPVIAANSIASALFQVIVVVAYGMAGASAVIIGKAVGGGERDRLREYAVTLQALYLAAGVALGLLLFSLRDIILSLYAITPEARELARGFMTVLSVTVVGTSYQCSCLTGIVRGGGDTRFVLYNDLIFMWGLVLPASLLAAFVLRWDPLWVFLCLKSDQITKCLVALWQVNSYRWVKRITREEAV